MTWCIKHYGRQGTLGSEPIRSLSVVGGPKLSRSPSLQRKRTSPDFFPSTTLRRDENKTGPTLDSCLTHLCAAAKMDFGTVRNHTVWQPEPLGRGTYGLLSSCLITMVLCVWTAVHLNIPEHRGHNFKYLPSFQAGRKILWLLVGLFAPEVVSWTAFEQRREAHALHEKIKKALGEKTPHPKSGGFSRWLRRAWKGGKEAEKEDVEKSASDGHDTGDSNVLRAPEEENGIASERRTQPASTASTTMGTTKRMNEWTITHSHYAIMGMSSPLWPGAFNMS